MSNSIAREDLIARAMLELAKDDASDEPMVTIGAEGAVGRESVVRAMSGEKWPELEAAMKECSEMAKSGNVPVKVAVALAVKAFELGYMYATVERRG